jgi:WXG100 family type VII secretion target
MSTTFVSIEPGAPIIRAEYDYLTDCLPFFQSEADMLDQMNQGLFQMVNHLRMGGWTGRAAEAFFAEFDEVLKPAVGRLIESLRDAGNTTGKVITTFQDAEEEAGALFRGKWQGEDGGKSAPNTTSGEQNDGVKQGGGDDKPPGYIGGTPWEKLSNEERLFAKMLILLGYIVRGVTTGEGKTPDFEVWRPDQVRPGETPVPGTGTTIELKNLITGDSNSILRRLKEALDQSPNVYVNAPNLKKEQFTEVLGSFWRLKYGEISSVTLAGEGYKITQISVEGGKGRITITSEQVNGAWTHSQQFERWNAEKGQWEVDPKGVEIPETWMGPKGATPGEIGDVVKGLPMDASAPGGITVLPNPEGERLPSVIDDPASAPLPGVPPLIPDNPEPGQANELPNTPPFIPPLFILPISGGGNPPMPPPNLGTIRYGASLFSPVPPGGGTYSDYWDYIVNPHHK